MTFERSRQKRAFSMGDDRLKIIFHLHSKLMDRSTFIIRVDPVSFF